MTDAMSALIVARPGPVREGLRAVLAAACSLGPVWEADSAGLALEKAEHQEIVPRLVLLSADGAVDQTLAEVRQIKSRWAEARFIILVDTVQQQQTARAAGVREVLVKGVRADEFLMRITRLLQE